MSFELPIVWITERNTYLIRQAGSSADSLVAVFRNSRDNRPGHVNREFNGEIMIVNTGAEDVFSSDRLKQYIDNGHGTDLHRRAYADLMQAKANYPKQTNE